MKKMSQRIKRIYQINIKFYLMGMRLTQVRYLIRIFYHEPTQTNTNLLFENHSYPSKSLKYKRSRRFYVNIRVKVRGVRVVRGEILFLFDVLTFQPASSAYPLFIF
jgi:hypothetical protein